jgi:branched-chain amino acid transport system substrate-binding protein
VNKKLLLIPLALLLALSLIAIGCPTTPTTTPPTTQPTTEPTKPKPPDYDTRESIVFGGARPLTGPLQIFELTSYGPCYQMWVDDVNAKGGIYVDEYDRQLPIEKKIYDDTSDLGTSTRLIEKLILEDEVDFLFPNCSTAFLYASAPLANKYGKVYVTGEGGCTTITAMLPELPYVFGTLNYSDYYQVPVLADTLAEAGAETAAIIYLNDLHGVEYYKTAIEEFMRVGINIVMAEAIPPYTEDVELVMKQAQDSGADILCAFVYPPTTMAVVGQAMALNYSPNALVIGPGSTAEYFKAAFGPAVEGIIGFGAFNAKCSPELAEYIDHFNDYWGEAGLAMFGTEKGILDYWASAIFYAGLECLEQAIERAGTLDQDAVRDILATEHFDTIYGDTWFYRPGITKGGGIMAKECHPGEIGQWQNGDLEVIGYDGVTDIIPSYVITADLVYPKPAWPAP